MSSPNGASPTLPAPMVEEDDEINLLELLDILLEARWVIASVFAAALALGGLYALLSTPIYEANTLIQVEESKGNGGASLLADAGSLFEIRSPASAEMEILKSRLVVGQAVKNLQLDLRVAPKYIPLVGGWLSRRAEGPAKPGFLGLSGYVHGTESIQVPEFEVPESENGQRFSIVLRETGFSLLSPEGREVTTGEIGKPLDFQLNGKPGQILVSKAVGLPGAEFYITRLSRLAVIENLQAALTISEQGKQSGVIKSSYQGADPKLIARILNEIGMLYVRQNVDRKAAEAEKSLGFLSTFLPQLHKQLEESEVQFNKFRNANSTFDLSSEAKAVLDEEVKLRTSLLELQQKRKELAAGFTALHPSVQTIDSQIKALEVEIAGLGSKTKGLPNVEQDLLRLTRDVKVNTELYTELLNSYQQLRLVKEGKVGNVRIVDTAAVPERAIKPQKPLVLALSGILGLVLGVALAFLRNNLRPGIKDAAEIEKHLGLHVFATVPHSPAQEAMAVEIRAKSPTVNLLATLHPNDPGIESLRSLRTALQFAMLDAPNNRVLFSGPTPGIGKTFTSTNFAAVLAAGGKRVVLVDADMRKGHIHQYFGLERGKGLSEVIAGTAAVHDVLKLGVAPGLDLLTTGSMPPNSAELLMAPSAMKLLNTLSEMYDVVLIDTPPVLAVSDTTVIAPQAGTVFMVARAETSTLGEIQEATKRLSQSGVAVKGVVFNDLKLSRRRYGYKYGYKYGGYRYTNYKY